MRKGWLFRCSLFVSAALAFGSIWAAGPSVSAGRTASFAIDRSGNLFGWGNDEFGQLGLGRELTRAVPRQLPDGSYKAVAVGTYSVLAVRTDGTLWSWGDNQKGQLGNGTTTSSSEPVYVGSGFRKVAIYGKSSFGLKEDGTLWAWGDNTYRTLGDGTTTQRNSPVLVGRGYAHIAVGDCTYAIKTDGALWRWGRCYWTGADGIAAERRLDPALVGTDFATISVCIAHAAGVKTDGSLWTWGHNWTGELGDRTTTPRLTPVKVGDGYAAAVASESVFPHTIALKRDGTLWGWGTNNRGVFGSGIVGGTYLEPVLIGTDFKTISCTDSCFGIKNDRTLWSWGYNFFGQLGDGTRQDRSEPKQIGIGFDAVAAGIVAAAIRTDGTLWVWGSNQWGQLGDTAPTMRSTPTLVGPEYAVVSTSSDIGFLEFHSNTMAIRRDKTLWGWGNNRYGQLGTGTKVDTSTPVRVGDDFVAVASTTHHGIGVQSDGGLWSWGDNSMGELGNGTTTPSLVPIKIGTDFTAVSATLHGSVALHKDGTVWTWGAYLNSVLGDGVTTSNRLVPARVPGLTNVIAISRGAFHVLALKSDGTVWGWGRNVNGELGDGTAVTRPLPTKVPSLSNVVAIAAGAWISFAVKSDGTLWVFGRDFDGLLQGDGTPFASYVPKQVDAGFSGVSVGDKHVLGRKVDGSLRSWGSNESGRLGDGTVAASLLPTLVVDQTATGFLSLLDGSFDNSLDPYKVLQVVDASTAKVTTTLTDLRIKGLSGDIFFPVIVPANSPLLSNCPTSSCGKTSLASSSGAVGATTRVRSVGPLSSKVVDSRTRPLSEASTGSVTGVISRGGFKQTGGASFVQADSAYTGVLDNSGTLSVVEKTVLENSNAIICVGVTIAELSAKGQVLVRPLATGSAIQGVVQCPPVQTAATIAQFSVEAVGPLTARTIVAVINPLAGDKGRAMKAFSWAVVPDGRQYMQTGPNQWEEMTEPMKPLRTISLPIAGSYRLEVTKDLKVDHLSGTLLFIGIGESWEEVRGLNRAGQYYTIR